MNQEFDIVWDGSVRDVVPFEQARLELAPRPYRPLPETVRMLCETCGDSFQVKASRVSRRRFCSTACRSRRVVRLCSYCGQPFEVPVKKREQRHCSRICALRRQAESGHTAKIARLSVAVRRQRRPA